MLAGAGTTFFISAATVCIGAAAGTLVGAFTGYFGGWLDEALMRVNDAVTAFPSILLALVFISLLGFGKYNVILALGVAFVPSYARVIRSEFARHREMNYVKSARLMGAGHLRIMFLHILPNTRQVLLPTLVIGFNNAVLAEASMSYLGIGVKPPDVSLGYMLSESQSYMARAPWYMLDGGRRDRAADFRRQPAWARACSKRNGGGDGMLEIRDLHVQFHGADHEAVRGIDLTVGDGEIVGLVGESGSGKTVTAMMISGLLRPEQAAFRGQILLDGRDLLTSSGDTLRSIQGRDICVVFQEPMSAMDPTMRIGPQVEECLRVHTDLPPGKRRELALQALRDVDLPEAEEVYRKYPHELSGGMLQRAMIAAAILPRPKLLLADEPTTALDVTIQAQILELLRRLNRERGMSILFISHNLAVVRKLCTRVAVMEKGHIVESGPVEDIFFHPQAPYTQRLIAAIPTRRKL